MPVFTIVSDPIESAHRFIPSRYDEPPILSDVTTRVEDLEKAYQLDSLTNPHHLSTTTGLIPEDGSIPNAHVINGAFTHGSTNARFSAPLHRAWYSSGDHATAQSEVAHHKLIEYSEVKEIRKFWPQEVKYTGWLCAYIAPLHELSTSSNNSKAILNPDQYVAAQKWSQRLRDEGSLGAIYPSVRNSGGVNHAIFQPHTVQHVRIGEHWSMITNGLTPKSIKWKKALPATRLEQVQQ